MEISKKKLAMLIEKTARGDRRAEKELFRHIVPQIELIVRTRLKSKLPKDDIDDIISDVKLAALNALRDGKFDPERNHSLASYVRGIADNKIALHFRKLYQQPKFQSIEDSAAMLQSNAPPVLKSLVAEESKDRLRKHLSKLKPIHKQVLLLRLYENKSIDEICRILNLENKQVIDLIHYAQKIFVKKCQNDNFFSIFSLLLQILV